LAKSPRQSGFEDRKKVIRYLCALYDQQHYKEKTRGLRNERGTVIGIATVHRSRLSRARYQILKVSLLNCTYGNSL